MQFNHHIRRRRLALAYCVHAAVPLRLGCHSPTAFEIKIMFGFLRLWPLLTCLFLIVFAGSIAKADEPVKVVYHVTDTDAQGMLAMGNIRNHLRADPTAKITLVALFKGINLLLEGTTDKNGNPYALAIEELAGKGVQFDICKNSMDFFKVNADQVLPQVKAVPSGVAEIARLQAKEHYVYIKP